LYEEPAFRVSAVILDHKIPCLGLSIEERFHVNIVKNGLTALGLSPGPWLTEFKNALYNQTDPNTKFMVKLDQREPAKKFVISELADHIARITPGQKISYITDVMYSRSNRQRIVEFVKGSNHLFIEAVFLDQDREIAEKKQHLTARQAGHLAGMAQIKQLTVFHFSPRYIGMEQELREEAKLAFEQCHRAERRLF
jgi:ribonuclease Z